MLLISWNVAGWVTTTAAIRSNFGDIRSYFDKTGADIICIQEAKVGKKKLLENPRESGACDVGNDLAEWESFWSCSEQLKTFNGVTTFVKKGLTSKADARPFRDPTLDQEGRCVVTYHSHFVLFNVYVPNSRSGDRTAFKLQFLAALRAAMDRVRKESSLPVILCGDMNLTYRLDDVHWIHRIISLPEAATRFFGQPPESAGKSQLAEKIVSFLRTSASVREQVAASNPGADVLTDSTAYEALTLLDFVRLGVTTVWADSLARGSANNNQNSDLNALSCVAGIVPHDGSAWVEELTADDKMVDALVFVHRGASGASSALRQCCPCPATCWNQSKNRRFQNEGNRIDYFFVDGELKGKLRHDVDSAVCAFASPSACVSTDDDPNYTYNGEGFVKSLQRATGNGAYVAAPFDGSGMTPLPDTHREIQFKGLPSTGLMATPPQYSDHIGISCLLDLQLSKRTQKCESGGCQYKPEQPSIASFFLRKTSSNLSAEEPAEKPTKKPRTEGNPLPATQAIEIIE